MAKKKKEAVFFEEDAFYHVYNRAVGGQRLFKSDENFRFFLRKFAYYLYPVVQTYAYCLLGNHFHLLIRARTTTDILVWNREQSKNPFLPETDSDSSAVHEIVNKQFSRFFQSYATAFNKQHSRFGTLFQKPFKRVAVRSEQYLMQLIFYIHANPQRHEIIGDFRNWTWSSYQSILSDKKSRLQQKEIIELFGGRKNFVDYHAEHQRSIEMEQLVEPLAFFQS